MRRKCAILASERAPDSEGDFMTVIKFENIDTTADNQVVDIPNHYAGLHWKNFGAFDSDAFPTSGYGVGTHSGHSVAINNGGKNATFSADHTFTLKNGYFTAGFDGERITVKAFHNNHLVGTKKFHIDETHQTFVHFGPKFAHIDKVVVATGGHQGTQVAIDDLTVKWDSQPGHVAMDAHHDSAAHIAAAEHLFDAGLSPVADHWLFI